MDQNIDADTRLAVAMEQVAQVHDERDLPAHAQLRLVEIHATLSGLREGCE